MSIELTPPEDMQLKKSKYLKQWLLKNEQRFKATKRAYKKSLELLWGAPGKLSPWSELVVDSECFVAQEVLPKMRFSGILITRIHNADFPCDIIAGDYNGRVYGFDVKLTISADVPRGKLELTKHFG